MNTPLSNSRSSTLFMPFGEACFYDKRLPDDWMVCVHPQGWIYFFNSTLKVVTDLDMRDPVIFQLTQKGCSNYPLSSLEDGMEIQLNIQTHSDPSSENAAAFTLVINHNHCVASYDIEEVKDVSLYSCDPKKLNRRRRLYWNHLWRHPAHVTLPVRAISDASDALTWFYTDNLISGSKSTVPFSKAECEELSRVVRDLSLPANDISISKTVFLAWLLREICSFRDAEYYGQHTQKESQMLREAAAPRAGSHVHSSPALLPVVNLIINLFFFGIPYTYYAHVKHTSEYRGRLASVQSNWEKYIERLVREYSHFLLISTVLLSATVGFLAVPNISEGAKVAATLSALSSLGSITVGVFSIWRHQANTRTADSFTYLHNAQHNYLGFRGHAILLSLPPTLLVWAILTFTISIVVYVMQGINDSTWSKISSWTIFTVFAILLITVVAALYTFSIIWKFQQRTYARIRYRIRSIWTRKSIPDGMA